MAVDRATPRRRVGAAAEVGLAELVAALSLASDLGVGQPMEHVLRGCLLAIGFLAKITVIYSRGWMILFYATTIPVLLVLRYILVRVTVSASSAKLGVPTRRRCRQTPSRDTEP